MLLLLLCGILFPHTHGYHYPETFYRYPSSLAPYGSIYQASNAFQTYHENHGINTFEKRQPEASYGTYENSQPYGNSHFQQYPWQTLWKKLGWIPNSDDGSQNGGQDTYGESHVGNVQDKPSQEQEEMFIPFEPTMNKQENTNNNSQHAETMFKPSTDKIIEHDDSEPTPFPGKTSYDDDNADLPLFPAKISEDNNYDSPTFPTKISDYDDSEPLPFPGNINDGDDSYSESRGDSGEPITPGDPSDGIKNSDKISPYTNPLGISEVSKPADEINEDKTDQSYIGNSDSVKILSKPADEINEDKTDQSSIGNPDSLSISEISKPGDEINEDKTDQSSIGNFDSLKISEISKPADEINADKTDQSYKGNSDSLKISEISKPADEINEDKTDQTSIGNSDSLRFGEISKPVDEIIKDETDQSSIENSDSLRISEISKPADEINADKTDQSSKGNSDSLKISEISKPADEINADKTDQSSIGNSNSLRISEISKPVDEIFKDETDQSSKGNSDSLKISEISKPADEINEDKTDQSSIGNSDSLRISEISKPVDEINKDETDQFSTENPDSLSISEISKPSDEINEDNTDQSSIGNSDSLKISEISKPADEINADKTDQSSIGNSNSLRISEISKPVDEIFKDETDQSSIGKSDSLRISEILKPVDEINKDETDESSIENSDSLRISEISKHADKINEDKTDQSSIENSDSLQISEVSKTADEINEGKTDQTSIGSPDFRLPEKKNITTPRPTYQTTTASPSGPQHGTMSRPVPKLGLLFAPSLQWHVGIYSKSFTPYMQVCGGSLVKTDVVLSAAHCFWNDDVGALRPGLFAIAAGKLLRPWEIEGEIYTQHSDIKDIKIPPRFRGGKTSFQDDIAVVLLTRSLEYAPGVKPVCVSFDLDLEREHLTSGNLGTIAGWGLTEPNGPPSQRLNYLQLPYVDIEECIRTAEDSFLKYITSDKICAGDQKTGRALCRGDSGGGLVFYSASVPYLHGIASTAPRDGNQCNAFAVASFTHVLAHRRFLIAHVPEIEEGCEELYGVESVQNKTTGAPQENATESNSPTQIQEDRIFTNPTPETISEPLILTAPSQPSEDLTDRMSQSEVFQNVTERTNLTVENDTEQLIDTPISESKEANESEGNEEAKETNEEAKERNEEAKQQNEESRKTNEESKTRFEVANEEEVVMNVESGEVGVARVLIDNNTRSFVLNCYCNK